MEVWHVRRKPGRSRDLLQELRLRPAAHAVRQAEEAVPEGVGARVNRVLDFLRRQGVPGQWHGREAGGDSNLQPRARTEDRRFRVPRTVLEWLVREGPRRG